MILKSLKLLLSFLTYFVFCTDSFSQNSDNQLFTKITYNLSYQLDSLNPLDIKTEKMELLFNDSISIFQSVSKGIRDSLTFEGKKVNHNYEVRNDRKFQLPRMKIYYSINRVGNSFWILDTYRFGGLISDNYQLYEENLTFDWKLTDKTDSLFGYLVQQATVTFGGRIWEAWYTPDIPFEAGPYKFYGLPGLIVFLKDKNGEWEFSLDNIELKKINRPITHRVRLDANIVKTNNLKFYKDREYYLKNRTLMDEASKEIIIESSEIRKKAIEADKLYAKKNNNWIELYQ